MKLGLALSGGGVRGAVHIGVIKALEENGIIPSYISGTSLGSIIASLYSANININEIEELFKDNAKKMIIDFDLSELFMYVKSLMLNLHKTVDGFIKGERIKKVLTDTFIQNGCMHIRQAKIPLAIPAVEINTAKTVMFVSDKTNLFDKDYIIYDDDIDIATAVRASISVPVLFKPCIVKGKMLVDGALKDNIPSAILKQMGADKVLAVNLGYAGRVVSDIDDVLEIAVQALDIMSYQISKVMLRQADYVLDPEVYDVTLLEVSRVPECIKRGYDAAMNKMPEIKRALNIES
ncbi:MAG: patatin-like phospholipase family protein [Ignavibacteriales bacterium]